METVDKQSVVPIIKDPAQKLKPKEIPEPATWREILPYYLAPVVFLTGVLSEVFFGNYFLIVWIPYVALPILDYILPVDHSNIPENRVRILEKDRRFLTPLYVICVMDFAILFWSIHKVSVGEAGTTNASFLLWALCAA